MLKKLLLSATAAVAMTTAMMGSALAYSHDVLRVGTEPTFAPFEFLNTKNNQITGYDIELIKVIGQKAGYEVEVMSMGFDALIPALATGQIDVIAAGMSVTEERSKKVDFTTPYYESGLSYITLKRNADKFPTFESLKGQTVSGQIGNTGVDYAKKVLKSKVLTFNTTSEAFMDLSSGNSSQAVVLDRPVLAYFLKTKPQQAKHFQLGKEIADAEWYAFAVKKGNKELLDKLNKAYDELKKEGVIQQIHDEWFAN